MFKKGYKAFISLALIAVIVFTFSACGNSSSSNVSAIQKIKNKGTIVLGTSADYPPYEFHKSVNGQDEIVGFDIDIANQVAKDLGVKLEIKDMQFDGLLAALDTGNVDFVIAGMTPTDARKKNVDFSQIYYTAVQTIVVRSADKDIITSVDALKGKKIGVQKGSIQEDIAKQQVPGAQAVALNKISDLVMALKEKRVDAIIMESPVATSYVKANNDIMISNIKLKTEDAGSAVAVKKGNQDLVDAINKTLTTLIKNGSIDKYVTDANNLVGQ